MILSIVIYSATRSSMLVNNTVNVLFSQIKEYDYFSPDRWSLLKNLSGSPDVKDLNFRSNSNGVQMAFFSDGSGSKTGFKGQFLEGILILFLN